MVVVKPGLVIPGGKNIKRGNSAKGPWACVNVKAERGYDKIRVWASNPEDIESALAVEIVSIDNVSLRSRLDESTGKWNKDYSVTATLRETDVPSNRSDDFMPVDEKSIDEMFGLNF